MKEAIGVAQVSRQRGDYAFGAVLVRDGQIVTASGNKVITYRDPTGHAELNCLRKAALREGHRHLQPGAVLYATHAPCPMCLAMCVWTKISGLVYGCYQRDIGEWGRAHAGPVFTWRSVQIEPDELYGFLSEAHPTMAIEGGFMREACLGLFHE
jgi:tRNA(Arg) A34 adenosine deaminase TadA